MAEEEDEKRRANGRIFLKYIEEGRYDHALEYAKSVGGAANIDALRPDESYTQSYHLWNAHRPTAIAWDIVFILLEARGWQWDISANTCFLTSTFRHLCNTDLGGDWTHFGKALDQRVDWSAAHPATLSSVMTVVEMATYRQQCDTDGRVARWLVPRMSCAALNHRDSRGQTPLERALTTKMPKDETDFAWVKTCHALLKRFDLVVLPRPEAIPLLLLSVNDWRSTKLKEARRQQDDLRVATESGFALAMTLTTWIHDLDALVVSYLVPPLPSE